MRLDFLLPWLLCAVLFTCVFIRQWRLPEEKVKEQEQMRLFKWGDLVYHRKE